MLVEDFQVQSPNVTYTDDHITSTYNYDSTKLTRTEKGSWVVSPTSTQYQFRVDRRVPKLGWVKNNLSDHNVQVVAAAHLALASVTLQCTASVVLLQGHAGRAGRQQWLNSPGWYFGQQAVSNTSCCADHGSVVCATPSASVVLTTGSASQACPLHVATIAPCSPQQSSKTVKLAA
jgi:hypothetical protein